MVAPKPGAPRPRMAPTTNLPAARSVRHPDPAPFVAVCRAARDDLDAGADIFEPEDRVIRAARVEGVRAVQACGTNKATAIDTAVAWLDDAAPLGADPMGRPDRIADPGHVAGFRARIRDAFVRGVMAGENERDTLAATRGSPTGTAANERPAPASIATDTRWTVPPGADEIVIVASLAVAAADTLRIVGPLCREVSIPGLFPCPEVATLFENVAAALAESGAAGAESVIDAIPETSPLWRVVGDARGCEGALPTAPDGVLLAARRLAADFAHRVIEHGGRALSTIPKDLPTAERQARTLRLTEQLLKAQTLLATLEGTGNAASATEDDPKAWRPFPLDLLPPVAAEFVASCARATSSDPAIAGLTVLGSIAASIGKAAVVAYTNDFIVPVNVTGCIVQESGAGKSPAQRVALRPLVELDAAHRRRFARLETEFKKAEEEYNDARAARRAGNASVTVPERPRRKHDNTVCHGSNFTVESVVDSLQSRLRGIALVADEIRIILENLNAYRSGGRGGDESFLLGLCDGSDLEIHRKGAGLLGTFLPRATASTWGLSQPAVVARLWGGERQDSGTASRFSFIAPPRVYRPLERYEVPGDVFEAFLVTLRNLQGVEVPWNQHSDEPLPPHVMRLDDEAAEAFAKTREAFTRDACDANGIAAQILSKGPGLALRLCGIVHGAACASGEERSDGRRLSMDDLWLIDPHSTVRACRLAEWLVRESLRVARQLWGEGTSDRRSPAADDVETLVRWAERREAPWSVRQLSAGPVCFRGASDRARKALAEALATGRVASLHGDKSGPLYAVARETPTGAKS